MTHVYAIETSDYVRINRIWDLCQYSGRNVPMYRARLSAGWISWVVELDDSSWSTRILLEHSEYLTCLTGTDYV